MFRPAGIIVIFAGMDLKIRPCTLIPILCLLFGKLAFSQLPGLSDRSQVSMLTCARGEALYSSFGHTAFRVQDPALDLDVVYNYGTFDSSKPNFYLNFVKGKMIYSLSRSHFNDFLFEYELEKRWVKEQLLDLDQGERNQMLAFFEENYRPMNREYAYDPLLNNCSTIAGTILKEQFGESIVFEDSHLERRYTFRELVRQFLPANSWSMLGIDLAFGSVVDRKASLQEHMFLPYYAMEQLRNTRLDGRPLLKRERTVLDYGEHVQQGLFPLSPLFWMVVLLAFTMAITYFDHTHKTRSRWLDFGLMFGSGFIGCFLLLLWLGTQHTSTPWNFNVLWAFPMNVVVAFVLAFQDRLPPWTPRYLWTALGAMALGLLLWGFGVQAFSPVLIPLMAALCIRYGYLIKYASL